MNEWESFRPRRQPKQSPVAWVLSAVALVWGAWWCADAYEANAAVEQHRADLAQARADVVQARDDIDVCRADLASAGR